MPRDPAPRTQEADLVHAIREAQERVDDVDNSTRETALVRTKLEEAEMWARRDVDRKISASARRTTQA